MTVDPYNMLPPNLKLDDLQLRDDTMPIRLSIMMTINDFRYGQLARSLECLARQDWMEFEVLICDNGGPQPLENVFNQFRPFLRLTTARLERVGHSACPSRGFKELLPLCRGEVIAIMQPEVMVQPSVAHFLYDAHFHEWSSVHRYKISRSPISLKGKPTWVIPKTGFFDESMFSRIDEIDWHTNVRAIESMPQYNQHKWGFSHMSNLAVTERREFPWWFVASAKRDAGIWDEMPVFRYHASIDFWLLSYRRIHEWVDICSHEIMGYHQWHHRSPPHLRQDVAPDVVPSIPVTEAECENSTLMDIQELRAICRSYGLDDTGNYEKCWREYLSARDKDGEIGHEPKKVRTMPAAYNVPFQNPPK